MGQCATQLHAVSPAASHDTSRTNADLVMEAKGRHSKLVPNSESTEPCGPHGSLFLKFVIIFGIKSDLFLK